MRTELQRVFLQNTFWDVTLRHRWCEVLRFTEHGPAIPDELLVARDEGQVLFFCGAGVSTAEARLPGFQKLAEDVLRELSGPSLIVQPDV